MAVDTPEKRKKAAGVPQPATTVPVPDGTIDVFDRGALSGVYLPTAPAVLASLGFVVYGDEDCFTLKIRTA